MLFFVNVLYFLSIPLVLIWVALSRLKGHPSRKGWKERLGFGRSLGPSTKRILLHAVSVGEVNAIRTLVHDLQTNGYEIVVSVTTDTGLRRAEELYGSHHTVTRYPLDFAFSVRAFLKRIQPNIIALVELEVWPNFIARCTKKKIPVVIINGRLSERSFNRYSLAKPLMKHTFSSITAIGMQNETYASRVRALGAMHVSVEGTMKWDNAEIVDTIEGADALAIELHINQDAPLVVAGSTTPEEHELFKDCLPEGVQLLVAPRRPEWFDEASKTLHPCNRRTSEMRVTTNHFVLDTIGELDKAYALADVVIIGRSFVPLHGSDPTVSIALGKPTIIGENASDFTDIVNELLKHNGIVQCTKDELASTLGKLLGDKDQQHSLAKQGRIVIQKNQGATKRYEQLIIENTPDA
ncbi:MAG: 3-deoxy-D-manno-octulosonic acid transferase [Phycisphaerales bacterium]|jgi:3-deoxy-D-manno-octulosonic-acid transferase